MYDYFNPKVNRARLGKKEREDIPCLSKHTMKIENMVV